MAVTFKKPYTKARKLVISDDEDSKETAKEELETGAEGLLHFFEREWFVDY